MNQTDFQGSDLKDFLNLTQVASPRIDGWLSKYLVKKTDNKLLVYPVDNKTEADGMNQLEEVTHHEKSNNLTDDETDVSNNLKEDGHSAQKNVNKKKTIAEKERYVKLLEKLLQQRLKRRLRKKSSTQDVRNLSNLPK